MLRGHVTLNEETWGVCIKRSTFALVACFILFFCTYAYLRVREIYTIQVELATLRVEYSELLKVHNAKLQELAQVQELTTQMLYGDVMEKLAKQPKGATHVELWQKNRDKSFNERISNTERRLMILERRAER